MSHGSSSTTSPMPRVRVPPHVVRLVVDYFAHAALPGDSARRAARRRLLLPRRASGCLGMSCGSSSTTSPRAGSSSTTSPRTARRRLLRLHRASECLGMSRGSSSTTSPTLRVRVTRHVTRLVVDYFSHAARPGASARCTAHHRLLRFARLVADYLPTPRIRVPRHVARLVVDFFPHAARPGALELHTTRSVARRRLLHLRSCPGVLARRVARC
jgi:hypothetical protein